MARLRADFKNGTLSSSVVAGTTTLASAAFAALPEVVAPDTLAIVVDPEAVGGAPEIVTVLDHAAGATTAGVARGQESTTARSHSAGVAWLHAATVQDFRPDASPVDCRDFGIYTWETSLGLNTTNGSEFITNSVHPFNKSDVGKVVIMNRAAGGATKFMSTIVDVSGVTAELADACDFTVTNDRITWGMDHTSLIADAFTEMKALDTDVTRVLRFPHGMYRASQIVVAKYCGIEGEGWGDPWGVFDGSVRLQQNTIFKQLPGSDVDHMVFEESVSISPSHGYCQFDRLYGFILEGPESNVNSYPVTAGGGLVTKTTAGKILQVNDGCLIDRVASSYHYDDGFYFAEMGPPTFVSNIRAFYNGRYGVNAEGGNPQAVHFFNVSGDGNSEGLVRVADVGNWSSILFTNVKSEQDESRDKQTGSNYQPHAIILDNVEGPVVVNGLTHISALNSPPGSGGTVYEAPGAAIKIVATAADNIPQLVWSGVGVRDHSVHDPSTTEVNGPGPTVEDTFNGFTSFRSAGTYGLGGESVYIPATGALTPTAGSPSVGLDSTSRRQLLLFDAAADETVAGTVLIPDGWTTVSVIVHWVNAGGGSGDVHWQVQGTVFDPGDSIAVNDPAGSLSGAFTAGAQNVLVASVPSGTLPVQAGPFMFRIKRTGTSGADTLGNDAGLVGVELVRAS